MGCGHAPDRVCPGIAPARQVHEAGGDCRSLRERVEGSRTIAGVGSGSAASARRRTSRGGGNFLAIAEPLFMMDGITDVDGGSYFN